MLPWAYIVNLSHGRGRGKGNSRLVPGDIGISNGREGELVARHYGIFWVVPIRK